MVKLLSVWAQAGTTVTQEMAAWTPWAQLGSTATFTGLAIWLVVKYLPGVHTRHSEELKAAAASFAEELRAARGEYREEVRSEREACERRYGKIAEHLDRQHEVLRELRHGLANVQQSWAGWRATNSVRSREEPGEGGPNE